MAPFSLSDEKLNSHSGARRPGALTAKRFVGQLPLCPCSLRVLHSGEPSTTPCPPPLAPLALLSPVSSSDTSSGREKKSLFQETRSCRFIVIHVPNRSCNFREVIASGLF